MTEHLLETTGAMVVGLDRTGRITLFNRAATKITGYASTEAKGTDWFELLAPRARYPESWAEFQRVLAGGEVQDFASWIVTKAGEERFLAWRTNPVMEDGAITGVLSLGIDLTECKRAETARATSEERYRTLVETSFDWVWEIDTQARYVFSSSRVEDFLGYTAKEVLGRTPFDFMPDAEAQRVRAVYQSFAATRQPFAGIENYNRHRNGQRVVLETNGKPVFAPDGTWLGYRGIDRDITARRMAEQALLLHDAALEAAANAIVITDSRGAIEWANPAFTTLSGWSLAEAVGKNPRDLLKSGKHEAAFYRQMWDTLSAGKVWRGELVNRRKDGALRTEDMTVTPLRNAQGEIAHYVAIKQDVTEQKKMESQLRQAQRMEAIGTLASGVAHDLNNILAPIMLVAGMLRNKVADAGDRELLAITQSSAQRGAEIIKQLLTLKRGNDGTRSVAQPRQLINELMPMMRATFAPAIDIQEQMSASVWPAMIDPNHLHQVLMNLCVNARDAMPDGGRLTVRATNVNLIDGDPVLPSHAKPGPHVCIEVSDTGHGIAPEIKHRIFDPFFTTKPLGKGTGLGLSTVLGIVQKHDGFLDVVSTPNKGTTFTVYLPAIPDGIEATAQVPAAPVSSSSAAARRS